MKYLLQIYDRGATEQVARLAAEEQQAVIGEYLAIGESPGVLGGEQLWPVDTATTVRVEGGQTASTPATAGVTGTSAPLTSSTWSTTTRCASARAR